MADELQGQALEDKINELGLEGLSHATADEKRAAVKAEEERLAAEGGGTPDAPADDAPAGDEPTGEGDPAAEDEPDEDEAEADGGEQPVGDQVTGTPEFEVQSQALDAVATPEQNAELEHTEGGVTSRDDTLDLGVPMVQGEPEEVQGPEDAFGEGLKRGDYRTRVGANHHESVPTENGGEPIYDEDGNIVDYEPRFAVVPQEPRTEDIGDDPGLKGGVETAA